MAQTEKLTITQKKKYLNDLKKELDIYTKKVANIKKDFKDNTQGNVEQITQSLQEILKEATIAYGKLESASSAEWDPVKTITTKAFNDLRRAFQEKFNDSTIQVKEFAGKVGENCQAQLDCVESYVKEHPLKSLLMAVGAGFLIGKIFK